MYFIMYWVHNWFLRWGIVLITCGLAWKNRDGNRDALQRYSLSVNNDSRCYKVFIHMPHPSRSQNASVNLVGILVCTNMIIAWSWYLMVVFFCLPITQHNYHHYADISKTYCIFQILVGYILSSVYLRLSQCPQLSFMWYMGLCVFSLPISLEMSERICVLIILLLSSNRT